MAGSMPAAEVASELGRSTWSVRSKAAELGVSLRVSSPRRRVWCPTCNKWRATDRLGQCPVCASMRAAERSEAAAAQAGAESRRWEPTPELLTDAEQDRDLRVAQARFAAARQRAHRARRSR